ncbi:Piso0_003821 [Millerozyma farinosa CBS 7064]|uniref:Mannosyl-oligosaccharide glucosidase n=1 Tax=Pichia sorbitophila (strain ATCC MYA-4447 / BCRC 22081 / CBS 7064 / NBRC 10061 / NRRL Y-12695) TaxID=559304 RepID=G8Y8E3_PICSO|nr:Piso0_003821 [Millerozyma farinosa CBS 7064]CCE84280.1 Piso0_003821 [Millerozyma farinosa CBS 7064]
MSQSPTEIHLTAEEKRLEENRKREKYWKKWGPYLSERQWATVREDYSANGDAWSDFPFEHSRSRTYRWGEDGLAGVSDTHQLICFHIALWNEQDDILKEKAFGLTNSQGNHGEDVKELYYYLDNTPSHSYMKYLYKYPHAAFPYKDLVDENARRSRLDPEYEIVDTGVFDDNKYFDVVFEMAKGDDDPDELLFRITAYNRGDEAAPLHIMPHVVLRNTWAWGTEDSQKGKPNLSLSEKGSVEIDHEKFGKRYFAFAPAPGVTEESDDIYPKVLFTENETNTKRLYDQENEFKYVKDAFHDYIINNDKEAINPENKGTKACSWFEFNEKGGVPPGDYVTIRYKLSKKNEDIDELDFDRIIARRQDEADAFYWKVTPLPISDELRQVQRQAFAGLLWTKQFYYFIHNYWFKGDPNTMKPPQNRANGRNKDWKHLYIDDILSMPDKWEYPFFAAWDTAFHCIPLAMIDPDFAKKQIDLLTREWYMHPNGQIPAYEWNFSDVNPPVHAWATYRIFKIERKMYKREDLDFLEAIFQKLLLNFTWWVNRKDHDGNNVFEGGFLGLDNIGIFNRSEPLPTGGNLEQADSTGWMAFFSLQMLNIALELAKTKPVYENIASKFFEHFILIADAMTYRGGDQDDSEKSLWDDETGFYYDAISFSNYTQRLPVRSLVGLIPLYASLTLEPVLLEKFPSFTKRLNWFIENRKKVAKRNIASMEDRGVGERLLLSLANKERLVAILEKMLDEDEFLSPYGIRSLSKLHEKEPFSMDVKGEKYVVEYLSGESDSGMFGGNSNWRGPIWFPVNFLIVEALQRFYLYYGPELKVECPKGSGEYLNLAQCAQEIQHRLMYLFLHNEDGSRACDGTHESLGKDPLFADYIPFYEYFDGDTGKGLGASHQCGWTALVAKWIHDNGVSCRTPGTPRTPRTPRSSVYMNSTENPTNLDPSDESLGRIKQYLPKSGPFPGRLMRRRTSKSLLNMTINSLDLSDEELAANTRENAQRMKTGNSSNASMADTISPSKSAETGEENSAVDDNLLYQIRAAFKKYRSKSKSGEDPNDLSGDEFETRKN